MFCIRCGQIWMPDRYTDAAGSGDTRYWRHAPLGDSWHQGETRVYWIKRITELRDADPTRWLE